MLIRPHTLSLITTHQCTAACDNCCFSCSPRVTAAIPVERLFSLIDEARDVDSIRVVVFTGGECFLLGSQLDALIKHAHTHGFTTRCVTNGYWGTSSQAANARANRLLSSGLSEINFSCGDHHAAFVPFERVLTAAEACLKVGIPTHINVEAFEGSCFEFNCLTAHPRLVGHLESGLLSIRSAVWINNSLGDGASTVAHPQSYSRFAPKRGGPCETVLDVVAITPTLSAVACCGLHLETIPELHLGSIAEMRISDVLAYARDDLIKIWMHVSGPEEILKFVKRHRPEFELPLEAVHPCESCAVVYKNKAVREVLRQHSAEIEDHVVRGYLNKLAVRELI